ncbi:MAG: hypothetical protein HQK50_04600 [Oligoflexia bacterium]|nr:hypothetical protein [Oligoflexia bacterium]MBF0364825.1 hypothetical protein [Oligoflexia bacterium]
MKVCTILIIVLNTVLISLPLGAIESTTIMGPHNIPICAYYSSANSKAAVESVLFELTKMLEHFYYLVDPNSLTQINCITPCANGDAAKCNLNGLDTLIIPAYWEKSADNSYSFSILLKHLLFGHSCKACAEIILAESDKDFSTKKMPLPLTYKAIVDHEFAHLLLDQYLNQVVQRDPTSYPILSQYIALQNRANSCSKEYNYYREKFSEWYNYKSSWPSFPFKLLAESYYGYHVVKGNFQSIRSRRSISETLLISVNSHSELFADLIAVLEQDDLDAIPKTLEESSSYQQSNRSFNCDHHLNLEHFKLTEDLEHQLFAPVRCYLGKKIKERSSNGKSFSAKEKEEFVMLFLPILFEHMEEVGAKISQQKELSPAYFSESSIDLNQSFLKKLQRKFH